MRRLLEYLERIANALEIIARLSEKIYSAQRYAPDWWDTKRREMDNPLLSVSGPHGSVPSRKEIAQLPQIKLHGKRIAHVTPKPAVQPVSLEGVKLPKKETVGHCWYIRALGVSMREMTTATKALGIANLGTSNNPRHKTSAVPAVVA